jgi:hypothetical protein
MTTSKVISSGLVGKGEFLWFLEGTPHGFTDRLSAQHAQRLQRYCKAEKETGASTWLISRKVFLRTTPCDQPRRRLAKVQCTLGKINAVFTGLPTAELQELWTQCGGRQPLRFTMGESRLPSVTRSWRPCCREAKSTSVSVLSLTVHHSMFLWRFVRQAL